MKRQIACLICGLWFGAGIGGCGSKGEQASGAGLGSGSGSAVTAAASTGAGTASGSGSGSGSGSAAAASSAATGTAAEPATTGPKLRALFEAAAETPANLKPALAAWAASGEPVVIVEHGESVGRLLSSMAAIRELMDSLQSSADPDVASLLSLFAGLRSPSNAPIAVAVGCNLALELAAQLLEQRKQPVTEPFRTYALSAADALAFGRASLASTLRLTRLISLEELQKEEAKAAAEQASGKAAKPGEAAAKAGEEEAPSSAEEVLRERKARGMPVTGDWLSAELEGYAAFWNETEALAAKLTKPEELAKLLDARRQAALAHPTSMLVRLVADMAFSEQGNALISKTAESARRYQSLIAPK